MQVSGISQRYTKLLNYIDCYSHLCITPFHKTSLSRLLDVGLDVG